MYTDGSKSPHGVGAAWKSMQWEMCVKLPDDTSVFHAELFAIGMALDFFNKRVKKVLICTDSLSALNAIRKIKCFDPLVVDIRNKIKATQAKIAFLWIPAHSGITENEKVDALAKFGAVNGELREIGLTHEDAKRKINRETWNLFQNEWNECRGEHKLGEIKPSVRPWKFSHLLKKKDEVIITRLRLGHTKLTHEYLMSGEVRNKCVCLEDLSVVHIFTCRNLVDVRYRFSIRGLETLKVDDIENQENVIKYIKAIKYYFRI